MTLACRLNRNGSGANGDRLEAIQLTIFSYLAIAGAESEESVSSTTRKRLLMPNIQVHSVMHYEVNLYNEIQGIDNGPRSVLTECCGQDDQEEVNSSFLSVMLLVSRFPTLGLEGREAGEKTVSYADLILLMPGPKFHVLFSSCPL